MKLIKDNESNVVPWLFEDSTTVTMQNDQIDVGDPEYLEFIIDAWVEPEEEEAEA